MKPARLLAVAITFLAAGCAAYTGVDAGKPTAVGDNVTVTPQIAWAQAAHPGVSGSLWTADGVALDSLMFFTGVAPGEPAIAVAGVGKNEVRVYQAGMLPDDVMELAVSNLSKLGYQRIQTANLHPAPFGQSDGFRFDLTCDTADGLDMKGMAIFTQRGGKLDLIVFLAPSEYYFGHYSDIVEKIFASIQAG